MTVIVVISTPLSFSNQSESSSGDEARERAARLIASSQNNLKQLGLVVRMFANETRGAVYPPLSSKAGQLSLSPQHVYPDYLNDARVLISPAHPRAEELSEAAEDEVTVMSVLTDHSYWYLGYTLTDEKSGLAFVDAYRAHARAGEASSYEMDLDTAVGKIYRLREGIERYLITDINNPGTPRTLAASIPVMIERLGLHEGGTNVLFMDGHVEFMEYPGTFPMTEKFIRALESLDELKSKR